MELTFEPHQLLPWLERNCGRRGWSSSGTTNAQMLASLQFASWDGIAAGGFAALLLLRWSRPGPTLNPDGPYNPRHCQCSNSALRRQTTPGMLDWHR